MESEDALREAHFQLHSKLQTAADVFQADLAQLTQDGVNQVGLTQWEEAYDQHTALLRVTYEEQLERIVADNITAKTIAT